MEGPRTSATNQGGALSKPPFSFYDLDGLAATDAKRRPGFQTAAPVILHFTKRTDDSALLRCIRDDGSATWQKQQGNHATFFPLHDLTHYAVETELGFRGGFYGLIAAGWEIADTTGKGARGPLPDEAIEVEYIVGSLAAERTGDSAVTAAEFNELAAAFAKTRGRNAPRPLTDAELAKIRSRMADLFARWNDLPSGGTLELGFPL